MLRFHYHVPHVHGDRVFWQVQVVLMFDHVSSFPGWFGICFPFLGTLGGAFRSQKKGLNLTPFLGVSNLQENYQIMWFKYINISIVHRCDLC